jgi:hypothetical protein
MSVTRRCSMVCYPLRLPRIPKIEPQVAVQLTRFAPELTTISNWEFLYSLMKPLNA